MSTSTRVRLLFLASMAAAYQPLAHAQLIECYQAGIFSGETGQGCIVKTLQEQIGSGHGDEYIFGSAVYLVKRDPARSIRRGRQLFQRKFSVEEKYVMSMAPFFLNQRY